MVKEQIPIPKEVCPNSYEAWYPIVTPSSWPTFKFYSRSKLTLVCSFSWKKLHHLQSILFSVFLHIHNLFWKAILSFLGTVIPTNFWLVKDCWKPATEIVHVKTMYTRFASVLYVSTASWLWQNYVEYLSWVVVKIYLVSFSSENFV